VNAFNPEIVVLGGGAIEAHPEIVSVVSEHVHQLAVPAARDAVQIEYGLMQAYAEGFALMEANDDNYPVPHASDRIPRRGRLRGSAALCHA
jgi:predicted NBD/HSP70 family sugar kinase